MLGVSNLLPNLVCFLGVPRPHEPHPTQDKTRQDKSYLQSKSKALGGNVKSTVLAPYKKDSVSLKPNHSLSFVDPQGVPPNSNHGLFYKAKNCQNKTKYQYQL